MPGSVFGAAATKRKTILSALCQVYLGNQGVNKDIYFCSVISLSASKLKVPLTD